MRSNVVCETTTDGGFALSTINQIRGIHPGISTLLLLGSYQSYHLIVYGFSVYERLPNASVSLAEICFARTGSVFCVCISLNMEPSPFCVFLFLFWASHVSLKLHFYGRQYPYLGGDKDAELEAGV
jgi:hypothetical protein